MKILEVIFFHVYNQYYKDGNFRNDIPHLTAFGIVGVSLSFLVVGIGNIIKIVVTDHKLTTLEYLILMLFSLLFLYFVLMRNEKYKTVYSELKDSDWDKLMVRICVWVFVGAGFLSFMALAFVFKNIPQ